MAFHVKHHGGAGMEVAKQQRRSRSTADGQGEVDRQDHQPNQARGQLDQRLELNGVQGKASLLSEAMRLHPPVLP